MQLILLLIPFRQEYNKVIPGTEVLGEFWTSDATANQSEILLQKWSS
jgi:hypothetical protein